LRAGWTAQWFELRKVCSKADFEGEKKRIEIISRTLVAEVYSPPSLTANTEILTGGTNANSD